MRSRKTMSMVLAVVVCSLCSVSQAALINVNYQRSGYGVPSGAGVVGQIGDIWNLVLESQRSTELALNDTKGIASGISIRPDAALNNYGNSSSTNPDPSNPGLNVFSSYISTAWGRYIIFSGFSQGDIVDVYCYSGTFNWSYDTKFGIGDDTASRKTLDNAVVTSTGFIENNNYALFSGVTPDENGEISVYVSGAYIAGFQLDVVPEPATAALLSIGGIAAMVRKKK